MKPQYSSNNIEFFKRIKAGKKKKKSNNKENQNQNGKGKYSLEIAYMSTLMTYWWGSLCPSIDLDQNQIFHP